MSELEKLGVPYEFVDAVSGDQISDGDLQNLYDADMNRSKFKRPLSRNEIACTLGHRKIWQQLADSGSSLSLVLEDDATFVTDPRVFLNELGHHADRFEDVMIKLDGVPRKKMQSVRKIADQDLVLTDRLPPRTTGYLLGRRAAARLAELDDPIARPVDIDLKFYWEHKVPILTLREQMIAERFNGYSNLEAGRRGSKSNSSVHRFLSNLLYQLKYTYGRLRHPLKPDAIEGLGPVLRGGSRIRA